MEALVRQAVSDLEEEEWESLQCVIDHQFRPHALIPSCMCRQRREYIASQILLVMTCKFELQSQIDVCEIAEKVSLMSLAAASGIISFFNISLTHNISFRWKLVASKRSRGM